MTSIMNVTIPPKGRIEDSKALRAVLEASGLQDDPFGQYHLLAGALKESQGPDGEAWLRFAQDLAAHLSATGLRRFVPTGQQPSEPLVTMEASVQRLAARAPIDTADVHERLIRVLDELRRQARDHAESVQIKQESDRKRFIEAMKDQLPIALITTIALTAQALRNLAGRQGGDREPLLAGLDAGIQAMQERGLQPNEALTNLIADARRAKPAEPSGNHRDNERGISL
ncbi:MAG: hypothetical protein ACLGJC_17315 [Alphaproteobacteria bacterium]